MSGKSFQNTAVFNSGEFLTYQADGEQIKLEVLLEQETLWLTQKAMAKLFQTTRQGIGQHLENIFAEDELDENSVTKDIFTIATDGKKCKTRLYNLDAIISVGYRVKAIAATRFHMWAMKQLQEHAIKKLALNDSRLKRPSVSDGADGFLERIMALYLDYAEAKAQRHEPVTMKQWAEKFDAFLQFDEHELLMNPRKVEAEVAKRLAEDCGEGLAASGHAKR